MDKRPGVPEMEALLEGFAIAHPDEELVVQCQDLAYPVACDVARRVAGRLKRSISVSLKTYERPDDRGMSPVLEPMTGTRWRLLVAGEPMTEGTVQPYEDGEQPE